MTCFTRFVACLICAFALALTAGCGQSKVNSAPAPTVHVKQFSGGVLIGEWDTDWIDRSPSGGWFYFTDAKTGRRVRITGDVQIF